VKTVSIPFGTYQYKVYRQLAAGFSWIPDPLNRVVIAPDQNSQLIVDSLVLFQMCAAPYSIEAGKFVVKTARPTLTAGIFQPAGAPAPAISLWIDGAAVDYHPAFFDASSGIFTYIPVSGLTDGMHTMKLSVSAGGQTRTDSVSFETRGRIIQIQSPSFTTRKTEFVTSGIVLAMVTSVRITVNNSVKEIPVIAGGFTDNTPLAEGKNVIRVSAGASADSIVVTRIVNHTPNANAKAVVSGGTDITLSASYTTDPDGETITNFTWLDDPAAPIGVNGKKGTQVAITKPKTAGEYYFTLIAADSAGNADTARCYFIIKADGGYENPTIASNPSWAKRARVYFMFPKGITKAGTLNAAALRPPYVRDMGFNVVWRMPIMKNAYPIDNNYGPGYNITDFYNVAPEYGTNQDFKNFMNQAHALGLKVILDVTPNHSSRSHPWSLDAHANKTKSPYWNWYQHQSIAHNMNGLGESKDADGFYYYSGFSDQLLNLNWTDVDMREEMINVYKHWIKEYGLDGYRFDVYWGPHRKYGEAAMGKPVRDALKHIKPDIFLLAEDDGTGSGTETIYADQVTGGGNGGVDAAYDFKLFFNQIRSFSFNAPAVSALNVEMLNGGYFPGPNSLYMRFMESQDEDRIAYVYSQMPGGGTFDAATTFQRTKPMATMLFTVPGFPMVWNGQEIGYGYGMTGSKENRTRTVIDWNYQGGPVLVPHYQRLAWIRGTYPAFATQSIVPISTGNGLVYGYTRPYAGENAIVLENFANIPLAAVIPLAASGTSPNVLGVVDGKKYIMSDVYNDSSSVVTFTGGAATLNVTVPAYGSAVYILSDSLRRLTLPTITSVGPTIASSAMPVEFGLDQNYPNPFNPSTMIGFRMASAGKASLRIYDVLGREVSVLVNAELPSGAHRAEWNAAGMPSGMYFYALTAGGATDVKRMMVLK